MSITVVKYENSLKKDWDNFINSSDNGTIFHHREFLTYHIGREFDDHSLLFYRKNKLVCVFTLFFATMIFILVSVPRVKTNRIDNPISIKSVLKVFRFKK